MKIVGIKGQSGSGKDTVGNYLVEKHKFVKTSFAYALKEVVSIITGWSMDMIMGETPKSRTFRETEVHPDFGMTCREMLQFIGTELFRVNFDPDTWTKITRRRIQELANQGHNVVITDVRFENEAQIILDLGGEIWSLSRDLNLDQVLISETTSQHISEKKFETQGEITIKNNGTLDELYQKVDEQLLVN